VGVNIAKALEVSLDYLVGQTSLEIDQQTLHRLEDIASLPEEEKNIVFKVVDSLLRDFKTRRAYAS
jgi:hypothetical protein